MLNPTTFTFSARVLAVCVVLSSGLMALAASPLREMIDPDVAGPPRQEAGQWRSRSQQVFDPANRKLARHTYTIWDPEPSRNLDFAWMPAEPSKDKAGRINGRGHLIWRFRDKPSFDRSSVFAEYRGSIRNGRIEGTGAWVDHTGLYYEGEFKAGQFDGRGTLKLPSGDEYEGDFRVGKANGFGRLIDAAGEVYEGAFRDGQRHGRGATTLPSGRRYISSWTLGRESDGSRRLRLAQRGGALPAADDVRIGVTVDKRLAPPKDGSQRVAHGDFFYAVRNSPSGLTIEPDNERFMSVWRGTTNIHVADRDLDWGSEAYGIVSLSPSQFVPLKLNFEIQNRQSSPLEITGASIAVVSSRLEARPAVQIGPHTAKNFRPSFEGHFTSVYYIDNFGWADLEAARLRFSFAAPQTTPNPEFTLDLGRVVETASFDLGPILSGLGVNMARLREAAPRGFTCATDDPKRCFRSLVDGGVFGALASRLTLNDRFINVRLVGSLDYQWRDGSGRIQTVSAPIEGRYQLGLLRIGFMGAEGGDRELISANPVMLRSDGENYILPVAYRASIPAGRSARFNLQLAAPKSSMHQFQFALQLADGREIKSRPINLTYYRPRWFTTTAKR